MPKHILLILVLILISGCAQPVEAPKGDVLAKVNDWFITKHEFEAEFAESVYSFRNTKASRKEFLENLINQKLILQDAQEKNIDKGPEFRKRIAKFWEQSLLKEAIDKKSQEFSDGDQMNQWIDGLRQDAQITIDESLLD